MNKTAELKAWHLGFNSLNGAINIKFCEALNKGSYSFNSLNGAINIDSALQRCIFPKPDEVENYRFLTLSLLYYFSLRGRGYYLYTHAL